MPAVLPTNVGNRLWEEERSGIGENRKYLNYSRQSVSERRLAEYGSCTPERLYEIDDSSEALLWSLRQVGLWGISSMVELYLYTVVTEVRFLYPLPIFFDAKFLSYF